MVLLSLPCVLGKLEYSLCPWTGDLLSTDTNCRNTQTTENLPDKVKNALAVCDRPYSLKRSSQALNKELPQANGLILTKNLLTSFCNLNFFLARRYANLKQLYFSDSVFAIEFFYSLTPVSQLNKLCLPRVLFAAKTSHSFDTDGVIFIGAFLPSRGMHAWIIEKGTQPDFRDDIWHQYRPIAAIY
jgi:hypothetical protein